VAESPGQQTARGGQKLAFYGVIGNGGEGCNLAAGGRHGCNLAAGRLDCPSLTLIAAQDT